MIENTQLTKEDYLKLKNIIYKVLKLENIIYEEDVIQGEIKNWTSLRHMLLIQEIEREFNIKFRIDEILQVKSFENAQEYVTRKISGQTNSFNINKLIDIHSN